MLKAPVVCMDFGRHSCIVVRATEKKVFFIAMQSEGLVLSSKGLEAFRAEWRPTDYDVARAAKFYLNAVSIPIEDSARNQLELLKDHASNGVAACPGAEISELVTGRPEIKEIKEMATTKKTAPKKAAPKAEKKGSTRKPGVGALTMAALLKGKDTATILMDISEQFPDSKAVSSTVSWYRSKMIKEGTLKA